MLNYAELKEMYKNIRIKQGIGLLVEANRAPRIRLLKQLKVHRQALSASPSFIYTLCMLLCVAFWAFIALWAFGG